LKGDVRDLMVIKNKLIVGFNNQAVQVFNWQKY
jgi:hypothetical protein